MKNLKRFIERMAQVLSVMWAALKEADYRADLRGRHYNEVKNETRARHYGFYRGGGF